MDHVHLLLTQAQTGLQLVQDGYLLAVYSVVGLDQVQGNLEYRPFLQRSYFLYVCHYSQFEFIPC